MLVNHGIINFFRSYIQVFFQVRFKLFSFRSSKQLINICLVLVSVWLYLYTADSKCWNAFTVVTLLTFCIWIELYKLSTFLISYWKTTKYVRVHFGSDLKFANNSIIFFFGIYTQVFFIIRLKLLSFRNSKQFTNICFIPVIVYSYFVHSRFKMLELIWNGFTASILHVNWIV